jgi:hypothetical protein
MSPQEMARRSLGDFGFVVASASLFVFFGGLFASLLLFSGDLSSIALASVSG